MWNAASKTKLFSILILIAVLLFACSTTETLSLADKQQVVKSVANLVEDRYIFADKAQKVSKALRDHLSSDELNRIKTKQQLASWVTVTMRKVARDKHLSLWKRSGLSLSKWLGKIEHLFSISGIEEATILEDNVGYLRLRNFRRLEASQNALDDAMSELRNSRGLVIDLCRNKGGEAETVAYLAGYLFDKPTLLNTIHWRQNDKVDSFYSAPIDEQLRYGEHKPIVVLVSRTTFSAAEEFAYDLQTLKRATVLGEITAGGAHPNKFYAIEPGFTASIPIGRALNPYTQTNWEGRGVQPDTMMSCQSALQEALRIMKQQEEGAQRRASG